MNAIIGMTNIAKSTTNVEKKNNALNKIDDASQHLLGIINNILDMSKIEADKLVLNPTAFNFKELISKVTDIIHFRIVEKQQMFAVHIDENIPNLLICDEQWLAQVIVNLLSNAVKFTPDKGAVSLVAALADEEPDFCVVRFEVMDTGVGINKEQQERLFHSFEQAESSTTRKYGGTGLGLAISKRVVEMMDGKIEVTSAPGKGSAFTFTIKAEIPHEVIKIQKQEDVEINREIVLALLEPTLIEIDCAENGREAVAMFSASPEKYDMIFMDLP
jgi:signal transduction histidine kinase